MVPSSVSLIVVLAEAWGPGGPVRPVLEPPVAVSVDVDETVLLLLQAVDLVDGPDAPYRGRPYVGDEDGARVHATALRLDVRVVQDVPEYLVRGLRHRGGGVGVESHARQPLHLVERAQVAVLGAAVRSRMDRVNGAAEQGDPPAEVGPCVVRAAAAEEAVPRRRLVEGGLGVDQLGVVDEDAYGASVQHDLQESGRAGRPDVRGGGDQAVDTIVDAAHLDARAGYSGIQVAIGVRVPEAEAAVIGRVLSALEGASDGDVGVAEVERGDARASARSAVRPGSHAVRGDAEASQALGPGPPGVVIGGACAEARAGCAGEGVVGVGGPYPDGASGPEQPAQRGGGVWRAVLVVVVSGSHNQDGQALRFTRTAALG